MTQPEPPADPTPVPPGARTEPRLPPVTTDVRVGGDVGGDVVGRDLHKTTTAGRDVVGGNVVTTTNVGFTIEAVQRLVIVVGLLVFVTAFCFFSSGFVLGGAALVALDRPVASSEAAAQRFAEGLAALRSLQPGQTAQFTFTEDEISSYFRFILGPNLGSMNVQDGRVRLMGDGQLVAGGRAAGLGGAQFAATFVVTQEIGRPLDLQAAAVRVLPTGTPFGWVLVPNVFLGGLEDSLNDQFGNVQVLDGVAHDDGKTWTVTVQGH